MAFYEVLFVEWVEGLIEIFSLVYIGNSACIHLIVKA